MRKHVSAFKGGRLAAAALPARLVNLTVSDVAGDHIDAITDPTVTDSTRAADAIAILYGHGLWDQTPASVREYLQTSAAESPELDPASIQTVLLVTGSTACDAMAIEAAALGPGPGRGLDHARGRGAPGRQAARQPRPPQRRARRAVRAQQRHARLRRREHRHPRRRGQLRRGRAEPGGRDRRGARARRVAPVAAVFLDTDGSDGGTAHAGAIVDGLTVERAAAAGLDLRAALLEHRSQVALSALEDAARHRTDRNQRQRPVRDRGRGKPMSDSASPMIVVDRLVKEFGEVRAVNDVSLEIAAGEFFSMLGPSGCGKTTTLRVIAGFEEPDAGRVLLDGEDVTFVSPKKRNVNMVFQDYALFPHMTVADNVAFGLKLKRVEAAELKLPGGRDADRGPPRRLRGPPPGRALRRPAPARRARPRARQPPGRAAARRAAGRPRPEAAPRDAARAEADPAEHRDDLRLRHPRPGGSADDVGPDRGHGRRRRPAGGRAAGALRAPGDRLRRRLHRHLEPAQPRRRRARANGVAVLDLGEGMRIVGARTTPATGSRSARRRSGSASSSTATARGSRAPWSSPSTSARSRRRWSRSSPASG